MLDVDSWVTESGVALKSESLRCVQLVPRRSKECLSSTRRRFDDPPSSISTSTWPGDLLVACCDDPSTLISALADSCALSMA